MRRSYARVDPRFSLCRSALVFFAAVLTVMAAAGPAGANYPRHVHFKTGGFPAGFVANVTVQSGSHCAENSDHLNIRASGTTKTTSWTFTVVNDTVGCFFSFSSFRYEISIGEELTIHGTHIFDQEAETHVRVEQIAPQLFTATNGHCGSLHYKVQCSSDGGRIVDFGMESQGRSGR